MRRDERPEERWRSAKRLRRSYVRTMRSLAAAWRGVGADLWHANGAAAGRAFAHASTWDARADAEDPSYYRDLGGEG
jgi:hypothetical protein